MFAEGRTKQEAKPEESSLEWPLIPVRSTPSTLLKKA